MTDETKKAVALALEFLAIFVGLALVAYAALVLLYAFMVFDSPYFTWEGMRIAIVIGIFVWVWFMVDESGFRKEMRK